MNKQNSLSALQYFQAPLLPLELKGVREGQKGLSLYSELMSILPYLFLINWKEGVAASHNPY